MSETFPSSGPVSMGSILSFVDENVDYGINNTNVSLRNLFQTMFAENFQPDGKSLFAPDKFSDMYGMLGYQNQPPELTMIGAESKTFIRGQY